MAGEAFVLRLVAGEAFVLRLVAGDAYDLKLSATFDQILAEGETCGDGGYTMSTEVTP